MNEIVIIVEGETEQTFVRDQLAGHLALLGTSAWAVLPGRHRNRGGVKKWEVARRDIIRTLGERRYCSMMMDYYAMPEDWPGRIDAKKLAWQDRAAHVEKHIAADIAAAMGDSFNPKYFIPYVQLHEFEALLFADVVNLTELVSALIPGNNEFHAHFLRILDQAGHPEAIDDGWATCPSRRISDVAPPFRKRIHSPIITGRIGLEIIREKCDHFASWLARLEAIGAN